MSVPLPAAPGGLSASQHLSKYLLERGFWANDAVPHPPQREHGQLKQLLNKAEMLTSGGASRSVLKCWPARVWEGSTLPKHAIRQA